MKKNYQTFWAVSRLKTRLKSILFSLATICCVSNSSNAQTGAALNFDGVDDYINAGNLVATQFSGVQPYTVETWIKPVNGFTTSVIAGMFNGGVTASWALFLNANGSLTSYRNVGPFSLVTPTNLILPNVWSHIATTYDGNTLAIYINGQLAASVAFTSGQPGTTAPLLIGSRLNAGNPELFFGGDMDEFRIWDVARSQCNINSYKDCEIATTASGLIANYHFNQGVAAASNTGLTSLTDATTNAFTGTLTNFTLSGASSNWVAPGGVVSGNTVTLVPSSTTITANGPTLICPSTSVQLSAGGNPSSLNFDGSNDYVSFPHNAGQTPTNEITIEAWIKPRTVFANTSNIIMKGNYGYGLSIGNDGCTGGNKINYWTSAGCFTALTSTGTITLNQWNHVAVVVKTTPTQSLEFFINGVSAGTFTTGVNINNGGNAALILGTQGTGCGCNYFDGFMDEIKIWDIARTQSQIVAGMNSSTPANSPNLQFYVTADNASGTAVNDLSANAANGTLLNGTTWEVPSSSPVSAGNSYVWSSGATTNTINVNVTSLNTVTVTNSFGCISMASQSVTVSAYGVPTVSIMESAGNTNIAVGGTATASSFYSGNPAADAFDGDIVTTGWGSTSGGVPAWLEYDFGTGNAKTLVKYAFYCASTMQGGWGSASYNPAAWTFEGFNGTTWVVLDTRTDNTPTQNIWNTFTFSNAISFQKYRINISLSGSSYTMITELRLYEASGVCNNKVFSSSINTFATPATYQWQVNGNNVGGNTASLSLPYFFINDIVTCNLTTTNTCVSNTVAASNQVVLTTGAVLNTLSPTICSGETYIAGTSTFSTSGTHTALAVAASGCDSIIIVNLTVALCTGINTLNSINELVKVYPNPNNGLFIIDLTTTSHVTITNTIGQVLLTETMLSGKHNVDILNLSTGVYFVKVIENNKQQMIKIIKH